MKSEGLYVTFRPLGFGRSRCSRTGRSSARRVGFGIRTSPVPFPFPFPFLCKGFEVNIGKVYVIVCFLSFLYIFLPCLLFFIIIVQLSPNLLLLLLFFPNCYSKITSLSLSLFPKFPNFFFLIDLVFTDSGANPSKQLYALALLYCEFWTDFYLFCDPILVFWGAGRGVSVDESRF